MTSESSTATRTRDAEAAEVYDDLQTAAWTGDHAIRAVLPLPPGILGHHSGGWVHTGTRANGSRYQVSRYSIEFGNHKHLATRVYYQALKFQRLWWPGATLDVEWRFAGPQPDDDGVWGRLASYRDAAQEAGIVADDLTIRMGHLELVRVSRKYQCVVLCFRIRHEQEAT